jgi:two-component system, NtrC family, nitrogen regulation sensor histidine kinase GlnL
MRAQTSAADPATILAALASPVIAIDREGRIRFVNPAAEQFLGSSAQSLAGSALADLLAPKSPLLALIERARQAESTVREYDMLLEGPRFGSRLLTIAAAPTGAGELVLSLEERSIAGKMDRHLVHQNAARSLTAMAAMLAHEVKNPLSGIRGAAQLLEQDADNSGRALTELICEETDRIVALLDRMESFASERPLARSAVNIHEVLERVRMAAQSGFARHVRFLESYDPSLPPVLGDRDLLVQVFLNLVKNAAEAASGKDAEISLKTAFRHGLKLAAPGGGRQHLPLLVAIADNGPGIPEELRPYLFEPFVTSKRNGTGLGLALAAKAIADHGGVIEFDSEPKRTEFRVFLPMAAAGESE